MSLFMWSAHLCGGGLMLGAWFMATDYVTSPITSSGKVIYAIGLGLLTFVLRIFGGSTEGVSYSIIIMNLLVPLIERATVPKAFGEGAEIKDKKQAKLAVKEAKKEAKKVMKTEDTWDGDDKEPKKKDKMDVKGIVVAIVAICVITVVMGAKTWRCLQCDEGSDREGTGTGKERCLCGGASGSNTYYERGRGWQCCKADQSTP